MLRTALRGSAIVFGLSLCVSPATAAAHAQGQVACGDTDALIQRIVDANTAGTGTVELTEDCTYAFHAAYLGGDNALPPITGKVAITGKDTTLFRSGAQFGHLFRLLAVEEGGELTLSGITVSGGHLPDQVEGGGGIFNEGTLLLERSKVTGNLSHHGGGGIYNLRGSVTLKSSRITTNVVRFDESGCAPFCAESGLGGGMRNLFGRVKLYDSEVSGNIADVDGGGIDNRGILLAERSVFARNVARGGDGGAVNNEGLGSLSSDATIEGSEFFDNTAFRSGGALYNQEGDSVDVSRTSFLENTAGEDGGAVANVGTATLTRSKVSENSAGRDGGGLNNGLPVSSTTSRLTLDHSRVTSNTAAGTGGGINNDTTGVVTIRASDVVKNRPNNCTGVTCGSDH